MFLFLLSLGSKALLTVVVVVSHLCQCSHETSVSYCSILTTQSGDFQLSLCVGSSNMYTSYLQIL